MISSSTSYQDCLPSLSADSAASSRSWHALMSDDYCRAQLPPVMSCIFYHFQAQESHLRWVTDNEYLCFSDYDVNLIDTKLGFLRSFKNIRIMDCCSGLLLCRLWDDTSPNVCVCNSATRRWNLLPRRPQRGAHSLIFDPKVSPHFGVVRFNTTGTSPTILAEVFSSETGDWAKTIMPMSPNTSFPCRRRRRRRRVFLNGILFTMACRNHLVAIDKKSMDSYRILMATGLIRNGLLGQSERKLRYANRENVEIKVWVLDDHHMHVWIPKRSVGLEIFEQQSNEPVAVVAFHPAS